MNGVSAMEQKHPGCSRKSTSFIRTAILATTISAYRRDLQCTADDRWRIYVRERPRRHDPATRWY